jgi:hypothetical protein
MTPLIQLHRQLQYLFIALLLGYFGIPAMGAQDNTPNHREIIINSIPQVLCANEKVDLRGILKLDFGVREFGGVRAVRPVDIKLQKGFSGTCPSAEETCLVGIGKTTRRRYVASKRLDMAGKGVETHELNGLGVGTFKLRFLITGNPNPPPQGDPNPGNEVRFKLLYTVSYRFSNNKVTFFKATPDICCPLSRCFDSNR